MANLGTWTITPNGYEEVESLTGVTFTAGNSYSMQIIGQAYIRRGSEGKGILINSDIPFDYNPSENDTLYISALYNVELNIDETVGV